MAVNDFPKKTSMGLTLEASAKLQEATKILGIDQNRLVCLLAEHFIDPNMDRLKELSAPFLSPRKGRKKNIDSLRTAISDLTPDERRRLLAELEGGK